MNRMQADTKSFIETQCRIAGCAREAKALSKGYSVIVEGCSGTDDDIADENYDFGGGADSLDNNNRTPGGSNSGGGADSLVNNRAPGGSNSGGAEDDNADESYDFGSGTTMEYGE